MLGFWCLGAGSEEPCKHTALLPVVRALQDGFSCSQTKGLSVSAWSFPCSRCWLQSQDPVGSGKALGARGTGKVRVRGRRCQINPGAKPIPGSSAPSWLSPPPPSPTRGPKTCQDVASPVPPCCLQLVLSPRNENPRRDPEGARRSRRGAELTPAAKPRLPSRIRLWNEKEGREQRLVRARRVGAPQKSCWDPIGGEISPLQSHLRGVPAAP